MSGELDLPTDNTYCYIGDIITYIHLYHLYTPISSIYIYIYRHMSIHIKIYLYTPISIYTNIYIHLYLYTYISIDTCLYTYISIYIYIYRHMSIYIYRCTYTSLCISTHLYLYTYPSIYTQVYIHTSITTDLHIYICMYVGSIKVCVSRAPTGGEEVQEAGAQGPARPVEHRLSGAGGLDIKDPQHPEALQHGP